MSTDAKSNKPAYPEPEGHLNEQTVALFHECCGDLRLNGYEIATQRITDELEKKLEKVANSESLEDYKLLTQELTVFILNNRKFLKYIDDRCDWDTGKFSF